MSNWKEAINRLAEGYMVSIAKGADTPQAITRDVYLDCRAAIRRRGKRRDDSPLGPLILLQYHHYQYDDEYGGINPQFVERVDQECITLATNWCREHWLPSFDPSWLTTTVVALAGNAAEPRLDRLPILADALQDAGCDHADILDHCRAPRHRTSAGAGWWIWCWGRVDARGGGATAMTKQEWVACIDPREMLEVGGPTRAIRRRRVLACAP